MYFLYGFLNYFYTNLKISLNLFNNVYTPYNQDHSHLCSGITPIYDIKQSLLAIPYHYFCIILIISRFKKFYGHGLEKDNEYNALIDRNYEVYSNIHVQ